MALWCGTVKGRTLRRLHAAWYGVDMPYGTAFTCRMVRRLHSQWCITGDGMRAGVLCAEHSLSGLVGRVERDESGIQDG